MPRLFFDDEGMETGFVCSSPGCGELAVHYDVEADRLLCEKCKEKADAIAE